MRVMRIIRITKLSLYISLFTFLYCSLFTKIPLFFILIPFTHSFHFVLYYLLGVSSVHNVSYIKGNSNNEY